MKFNRWLVFAFTLFLHACQSTTPPTITIIADGQVFSFQSEGIIPSPLIAEAGINVNPNDRVLLNGDEIAIEQPIPKKPIVLQIRRAVKLFLDTPNERQEFQSSAFTVGEALEEISYQAQAGDDIFPPLSTPVTDGMSITVTASRDLTISVDGNIARLKSSALTVGEALAEAGIPLLELDQAFPSENEALPPDGNIKVVRVRESVILAQKPIPFQNELIASTDIPLDQTQILSPGETGLSLQRIRVRYEDGQEISRTTEDETTVRPPKTRTLGYGTKVEVKTATVNGAQIEYWRAVQMYATSYSPCNLGTTYCGSTTASGKQLQKGMVALRTDLYLQMKGQRLYIPGYGFATVEDACGGCVGKPWIDLGFSDEDFEGWYSWVTVYFLTPVPQNIVFILE